MTGVDRACGSVVIALLPSVILCLIFTLLNKLMLATVPYWPSMDENTVVVKVLSGFSLHSKISIIINL